MEDKIIEAMKKAGKPMRPGEIAEAIGQDSKDVSKALASMKKKGQVESPKRCYYAPCE